MTDGFGSFILICFATGLLIGGITGLAVRLLGWMP